jgi:hypothetical protein
VSGYTPVFESVFQGTLCGKWPTLPVWLTILPMADKNGHIDTTYQAMSAVSGWPTELLKQAITELMQPDPESRSCEAEGRRLELLDPQNRQWGWRFVNHARYREKARKKMQQIEATASGRDAERKRVDRERAQRRPAASGSDRLSDSDSDSDSKHKNQSSQQVASFPEAPIEIFRLLSSTGGKEPKRTRQLQHAIDAAGGLPTILARNDFNAAKIEKQFCVAYRDAIESALPQLSQGIRMRGS